VRRDALIAIIERLDQELQAQLEAAANLLREVIVADDLSAVLRDHLAQLDDAFTMVIEANLDNARRARRDDIVERLEAIRATAQQVRDEALTPEERFIRELLAAETPQAATRRLRQSPAQITTALVRRMNELVDTLAGQGKADEADLVRRLAREAGAMLF
jgi:LPS O-antigen subunit length determinant protein (WzzB/FepE family)